MDSGIIISLLAKTIKSKYPDSKIYIDEVKQGLKKPCFFIYQINAEHNKNTKDIFVRDYLFNIRFHTDEGRGELNRVGNTLLEILEEIDYTSSVLRPYKLTYEVNEDVLHVFLGYRVRLYKEEEKGVAMKDMTIEGGI